MIKRGGLGKGMAALLPVVSASGDSDRNYFNCPVEQIRPNRNQPRKQFSQEKLDDLAASIREKGVIQPIIVTKKEGVYEIVAGERRWRAAQRAGLHELPVIIREASENLALELALIENIQREDLNAIEEAQAYRSLVEQFGISQEEVAKRVGKNRTTVTNMLRLLRLPEEIQQDLLEGRLDTGHARALLGLENAELVNIARNEIIQKQLSVRATEELVNRLKSGKAAGTSRQAKEPDLHISSLEEQLKKQFQTRIAIRCSNTGKGSLSIHFNSADELTRIMELLQN